MTKVYLFIVDPDLDYDITLVSMHLFMSAEKSTHWLKPSFTNLDEQITVVYFVGYMYYIVYVYDFYPFKMYKHLIQNN